MSSVPPSRSTVAHAVRAGGLTHPVAVVAIALLVLNDHVLKAAVPGVLTGKLSDVAGMVFFPLLLQALVELADRREPFTPSRAVLVACAGATGLFFAATNLWEPAGDAWRWGLGLLQWPYHWAVSGGTAAWVPVRHTLDPTDALVAPVVAVPVALGWMRGPRG